MDSTSSPSDIDSTSKLLASLDLIETMKKKSPKKKMEDMNIDYMLEIPDTPDRLVAMRKLNRPSDPPIELEVSVRTGYTHHGRNSRHHNASGSSSSNPQHDIDHLFRQANLARKISEALDSKVSPPQTQVTQLEAMPNVASGESGGRERVIDICKESLFPSPHPTQWGDSRRKIEKDTCIESDSDFFSRSQDEDLVLNNHNAFHDQSEEIIDLSGGKSPSYLSCFNQWADGDSTARIQGRGMEFIDLSRQNGSLSSYPTRSRGLRRKNGKDLCSESDGLSSVRTGKANIFDRDHIESTQRNNGKGIDPGNDSEANIGLGQLRPLQLDVSQRNMGKRRLMCNGWTSLCNIAKGNASAELDGQNGISNETVSSFSGISNQDKGKGIDLPSDIHSEKIQTSISKLQDNPPPRHTRQRKLVRNGCISPYNIAKVKNATKVKDSFGKNGLKEDPDTLSSHQIQQIQIVSPDTENSCADKKKGRIILHSGLAAKSQDDISNSSSNRVCFTSGKDLTVNEVVSGNSLGGSENTGWRKTCNHTGSNPSQGGSSSELESERRRHHGLQTQLKGKRKCSTLCSHAGEGSGSHFEDSEILYHRSSRQPLSSKSTKNLDSQQRRGVLGPVIEVDELLSPEVRSGYSEGQSSRVSDDCNARARQVESDEMLARQLQEEFYHESPGFENAEEMDANLAWSLQQEDVQRAASFARRGQSYSRGMSIAPLYAASLPRPSFRNSSSRSTARARVPAMNRIAQLRRHFARHEMDLEARLDFLEAVEAVFDSANDVPNSSYVLQVQHDFNENDYEMLLSLDENNHQHSGASDSQINSLPQSVIQSNNNIEACAVCLETFSVGDIVRHLPCLHKFHKDCIDTWLRRKTSCPICKSGIS